MPPGQTAALDLPLINGDQLWEFCSLSRTGSMGGLSTTPLPRDVLSLPEEGQAVLAPKGPVQGHRGRMEEREGSGEVRVQG